MTAKKNNSCNTCLFILTIFFPALLFAQKGSFPLARKYKPGETCQYRLTTEQWNGGTWSSTIISVCELTTVVDTAGVAFDEVHWLSKKTLTPADTIDETSAAQAVKPFRISVDPRGTIKLPKIEIPEMTEPIQDLITFWVAVSPQLGADKLTRLGDSIVQKKLVPADFSNGHPIIRGNDCFQVTLQLTDLTDSQATAKISFLPPDRPCFHYVLKEMRKPVIVDTANNFQMLQEVDGSRLNIQYGREKFIINSVSRRSDGKIESANMLNTLDLKLKLKCTSEYRDCQGEVRYVMQRALHLELL